MLLLIETWSRRLLLILRLHQLFDRQVRFREALLHPGQRKGQRPRFGLAGGAQALRQMRFASAASNAPCRR